jgi:signal transduction histidine kinase
VLDLFCHLIASDVLIPTGNLGDEQGSPTLLVCGHVFLAAIDLAIPGCLAYIFWKRKGLPFRPLFMMLAAYLVACGTTHFTNVISFLVPVYRVSGLLLDISAAIGICACVLFMCLIPRILSTPGPEALTIEIGERRKSERELRELKTHLEERVRERTVELESRNEDLSQFAFAASHDLQEPLRMMAIYSEVLHQSYGEALDDEAREFIGHIVSGSRRMTKLLDDLLAYTKLVSGDVETNGPLEAPTEHVLHHVMHDLQQQIAISGARITWDELPTFHVSETHLRQLLQNVISNAIKYRGKPTPGIHLSSRQQGDECLLSIKDNGIGIGARYHRQIFGVFKRLHGREVPGTGMGLPICQKIVERYGGRIWVESELGSGATFFIRLPGLHAQPGRSIPAKVRKNT